MNLMIIFKNLNNFLTKSLKPKLSKSNQSNENSKQKIT